MDCLHHNDSIAQSPNNNASNGADLEKRQTALSSASIPESYPEGGLQAWLVVVGAWFSLFASFGLLNTIAVFQTYTLENQLSSYSEGTVGWVFSVYTFLTFFGGVYIGPVFDKYGPRWLLVAGTVCTVGGMVLLSFCTDLWMFLVVFGVILGTGSSLIFTPCIAAVGHWFKVRRGLATGVASTAGGIGGVIYPLMLSRLFESIGYGWAVRVLGLICLICCCIGIILVRSRLPPAQNASPHPDFKIFKQIPFLHLSLGIFLLEFSLFIPLAYISSYAIRQGFSSEFSFNLIPILNASSVMGRVLPGWYADKVGPINVCIASVILSFIACLCVWLPAGHTAAGVIIFTILFGFGSGTSIAVAPVCVGQLCKTQEYGRYYATTYTLVSFACLIGIPIAGNIVEAQDGAYQGLIILTGGVYVFSMLFLLLAKTSRLGWKKGWRARY
ncbi:MFS general substrate transporter [Sarocladium strictum]